MGRLPQGYLGISHETRGGDILAVLKVLHSPEVTLGPELYSRFVGVNPEDWYPIENFLEMLEKLDGKLGSYGLRQVGWKIFSTFHAAKARELFTTARGLLNGLDHMYHQANRGTKIGGWKLSQFEPGLAVVEKSTPHHCGMELGILEEAMRTINVRADVSHLACFRTGAPLCRFQVTTRAVDERWG